MARKQSVKAEAADDRRWTVMVFMGADAIPGDFPLVEPAKADIVEMGAVGSGRRLNIFVQVSGIDDVPRRAQILEGATWEAIQADEKTIVPDDEQDNKDGDALCAFIAYALKEDKRLAAAQGMYDPLDPHHYTMLVLWGHAYDFAIDRVPTLSGRPNALDYVELSDVLERMQSSVQHSLKLPEVPRLSVIGFDACDAAT